jgi:hypothetical protein
MSRWIAPIADPRRTLRPLVNLRVSKKRHLGSGGQRES